MTLLYDVITVGGGLAGSAVAKCLAGHGYRVLVLERERRFRDRVRGEQMHPWGVAEARTLGLYQRLAETCGHQTRWWTTYQGSTPLRRRDLVQTTPHQVGSFNFYHPDMPRRPSPAGRSLAALCGIRRNAVTIGTTGEFVQSCPSEMP